MLYRNEMMFRLFLTLHSRKERGSGSKELVFAFNFSKVLWIKMKKFG